MFEPLRKYATFAGRARRKEYWLWQVFMFLFFTALYIWLFSTVPGQRSAVGSWGISNASSRTPFP